MWSQVASVECDDIVSRCVCLHVGQAGIYPVVCLFTLVSLCW